MHSASQWACATPHAASREDWTMSLIKRIALRLRLETGATMVEYGLMVALIAVFAIGAVTALGFNVAGIFTTIGYAI